MEKGVNLMEENLDLLDKDFEELQQTVESINNNLWKNNIRLRGLREGGGS